jgi:serine/threonine protein kinase
MYEFQDKIYSSSMGSIYLISADNEIKDPVFKGEIKDLILNPIKFIEIHLRKDNDENKSCDLVCSNDNKKHKYIVKFYNHEKNFNNEKDILAKLNHPNIIKCQQEIEIKLFPALVFNYYEMGNICFLNECKDDKAILFNIFKKCIDAFSYCNKQRIIHCDIKPENILLDEKRNPIIIDFGSSKILPESSNFLILRKHQGTMIFLAPESIKNLIYYLESDIWSFGMMIHEICLDFHPFDTEYFDDDDNLLNDICSFVFHPPGEEAFPGINEFLSLIFKFEPTDRISWDKMYDTDFIKLNT